MIIKKIWSSRYNAPERKLYVGYFLFGIIPLYISIQPIHYIIKK